MKIRMVTSIISIALLSITSGSAFAQNFTLHAQPNETKSAGIRFMSPSINWYFPGMSSADILHRDLSTASGIYDLYLNLPLGESLNLDISVPFAYVDEISIEKQKSIQNIYVGIQHLQNVSPEKAITLSFGVHLPTASNEAGGASFVALYTNYYDFLKYMPDAVGVYGNLAYRTTREWGVIGGLEIGPNVWFIETNEGGNVSSSEFFLHYGFYSGFAFNKVSILGELAGIASLSESSSSFRDMFAHSLTLGTQLIDSPIRPGVFYKIYLKDYLDKVVDGVMGFKVEVSI